VMLTDLGHRQLMADVPRTGLKDQLLLTTQEVGVEVGVNG